MTSRSAARKLQRFKREAVSWLSESTKDCNCTAAKNRRHQLGPVKPSRILPDIVDSHGLLFPSHICAVAPGLHGAAWPTHSRLPRKYPKRPKAPFRARTLCRGLSIYPRVGGASSRNNATFSATFSVKDANCLGICQSM